MSNTGKIEKPKNWKRSLRHARRGIHFRYFLYTLIVAFISLEVATHVFVKAHMNRFHGMWNWETYNHRYPRLTPNFKFTFTQTRDIPGSYNPMETTLNSEGFRDEEFNEHPKGSLPILIQCYGDSYTFGWGINVEHSYPHVIQTKLQHAVPGGADMIDVHNLGEPGMNFAEEAQMFQEYGTQYNPDIALFFFDGADLKPSLFEHFYRYRWLIRMPFEIFKLSVLFLPHHNFGEFATQEQVEAFKRQVAAVIETGEARDIRIAFVIITRDRNYIVARQAFSGPSTGFLDVTHLVQEHDDLLIPNDFHFNEKGCELVAQSVCQFLHTWPAFNEKLEHAKSLKTGNTKISNRTLNQFVESRKEARID